MLMLDTQLAFWWQTGGPRLPATARTLVEDNAGQVFVSRASLWELAIKSGLGRVRIDLPAFADAVGRLGFDWLPIEEAHLLQVARLPVYVDHKDPFDRLLVAQSLAEPLILLTVDARLARYGTTVRVL